MKSRAADLVVGVVAVLALLLLLLGPTPLGERYGDVFQAANLGVLLVFVADVLLRFALSREKKPFLRRRWFDAVVFLPFVQYIPGIQARDVFVIVRQVVIVVVLLSRVRKAGRFLALLGLRPAQTMAASFLFAITTGAVLLMLPAATTGSEDISLPDALFTATSAVCVTGLIVQDTAAYFTTFGQLVILGLIQAGGLGIMTFSVTLAVFMGKSLDVRQRAAVQDMLDADTLAGVKRLALFIVGMTAVIELAGAVALFTTWLPAFGSVRETALHAAFHAVSAFCNAGFSTFTDSLSRFRGHLSTNIVICLLIIGGGAGFLVIRDLFNTVTRRGSYRERRVTTQTKTVLATTAVLVTVGALTVFVLERNASFRDLSATDTVLASIFQSVPARTAGFNTRSDGNNDSHVYRRIPGVYRRRHQNDNRCGHHRCHCCTLPQPRENGDVSTHHPSRCGNESSDGPMPVPYGRRPVQRPSPVCRGQTAPGCSL